MADHALPFFMYIDDSSSSTEGVSMDIHVRLDSNVRLIFSLNTSRALCHFNMHSQQREMQNIGMC